MYLKKNGPKKIYKMKYLTKKLIMCIKNYNSNFYLKIKIIKVTAF